MKKLIGQHVTAIAGLGPQKNQEVFGVLGYENGIYYVTVIDADGDETDVTVYSSTIKEN